MSCTNCLNPIVSPITTSDYFIYVIDDNGCENSDSVKIILDGSLYVPNAFTPDNAGPTTNEGFHAIISGERDMELIIFNRWGEIMFRTTDKNEKWDGNYKNAPAQQDVYAYKLIAHSLNGEEYLYSGTITLIR